MEWEAPAIVLSAAPYGEGGVVAHVFARERGSFRGLVRGGASRAQAAIWQPGNLIRADWRARLVDQLGTLKGELVHPCAAGAMNSAFCLAMLSAACAVADGALPEREAHPDCFEALITLLTLVGVNPADGEGRGPAALVRWEASLLRELGYGLDLSRCAATGEREGLDLVSPRTGRAVRSDAAGEWRDRMLRLPPLLMDPAVDGDPEQWRDGLALTGHFLARDVFGVRHRPVPAARVRLVDMVERMADGGAAPAA
ncbi:MAG: DNA repair protein RecO [Gluconacetobacter diazotrophicus]|nr:DNA repair protein RecO [Gluconacetobacter diazotrophicus]